MAINSALRGGDLLAIKRADLEPRPDGKLDLLMRESKTGKLRRLVLNEAVAAAVRQWLTVHPMRTVYLFEGTRGRMNTAYWSQLMKSWCREAGWNEARVATHSARKTWVRTHYERGVKLATLMHALNHDSERTTLLYMGLLQEDVAQVYADPV